MYFDITHNIEVNKKLIKIVGLSCATYWAELACILRKVYKKETYDTATGFFRLDRRYVEDQIGLSLEEQYQCDTILIKLGAMAQDESDPTRSTIRLSAAKVVSMIVEDDPVNMAKIAKSIKITAEDKANAKRLSKAMTAEEREQAKQKKRAGLIAGRVKQAKQILCHAEFDDLYEAWVRSVYEGGKYLTDSDIQNFHQVIWSYTSDPEVYRKIFQIAITNHWINATWAVSNYQKDIKFTGGSRIAGDQKIATSISQINQEVTF